MSQPIIHNAATAVKDTARIKVLTCGDGDRLVIEPMR
jgi:hypothetical protein